MIKQYTETDYGCKEAHLGEYVLVEDLLSVLKTALEDCRDDPDTLWDCIEELIGELSDY